MNSICFKGRDNNLYGYVDTSSQDINCDVTAESDKEETVYTGFVSETKIYGYTK